MNIRHPKATAVVSIVVLVVAAYSIWLTLKPPTPTDTRPLFLGVGEVLAQETATAVGDRGRIVVVVPYDYGKRGSPPDYRWDGFRDELKKHPAISVVATEVVQPDMSEGIAGCPSATFKSLLDRHTEVDAIVFFVQLPPWSRAGVLIPRGRLPKIIALDWNGMPAIRFYTDYLASGIVSAMIVAQPGPAAGPPAPAGSTRAWFDKYYKVLTPANFASLME